MSLILQPDLAAQIPGPQPKPTTPGLILEAQSSGPWFAAFTHAALSTVPKENRFAAHQPSWQVLGFHQWQARPRSAWKHHRAVLHSCIFLGKVIKRVLHKTSTCKLSQEAESSYKNSLAALIQEGWWALRGGDYGAQDLDFFFPQPSEQSALAKGYF